MKLNQLSLHKLQKTLSASGLCLNTPPFTTRFFSKCSNVIQNLRAMYGDYPISEAQFADFDVSIRYQRQWYKPQAQFYFDDFAPFLPLPKQQDYAMLEWGLNWCYANHAHEYLILHAAVIAQKNKGIIMPGFPGAGKSTLTAELMFNDWQLLSDELTLIDDIHHLIPSPRPVSLKNQSIDIIQNRHPQSVFTSIAKDTAKGTVAHLKPKHSDIEQAHQKATPFAIVFPHYQANAALTTKQLDPAEALVVLAEQGFNYHLLKQEGFHRLSAVIDACQDRCFHLTYSALDDAVSWYKELIG